MKKLVNFFKENSKKSKLFLAVFLVISGVSLYGLYALAQSVIDSFTTTDNVADTWNVTVDTGTGEVKLSEQSCDNGVWFCGAGFDDVCSNSLGDGTNIIVKRTNETSAQWKTSDTACDKPHCGTDGGQNGDNLVADNTVNFGASYPARNACEAAGGRLPTLAELQCIYTNRVTFGNNFTSYCWSSTESSTTYAWSVNFDNGNTDYYNESYSYSVRCVRGW